MPETPIVQDAPVISYVTASADMRYIETGERQVYLRNDPKAGLIFQGEMPGCRPGCYINLNDILLEYAMSCEGCREEEVVSKEVTRFGGQLGEKLAAKIQQKKAGKTAAEKLSSGFKCVLNSMDAMYIEDRKENHLDYSLDCCPLSECANRTGLNRSVEMADVSFTALCNSLVKVLAPDWVLKQPSENNVNIPMHKIVLTKLQ